jgi:ubiquinone/menaquinone biosynthesis C-methylase UbiE
MEPRTTHWIDDSKVNYAYHERQFKEPYRSTVAFCKWIESIGLINSESRLDILDLCSGAGANIYHMSKRYPNISFTGVDINVSLVEHGNEYFKKYGISQCNLELGDIYNLDAKYANRFDGVVMFQTLCCLPDFKSPIEAMAHLGPQWIAVTSLAYDGQVSCTIEVTEYDDAVNPYRESFYNIYSIPALKKCFENNGYPNVQAIPFEIDIDLPKPNDTKMTTFTKALDDGHRLQISGPLLMPWYFIVAKK